MIKNRVAILSELQKNKSTVYIRRGTVSKKTRINDMQNSKTVHLDKLKVELSEYLKKRSFSKT